MMLTLSPGTNNIHRPIGQEDEVLLRGLGDNGQPLILERVMEGNFIQAMFDDLTQGIEVIGQTRARDTARLRLQSGTVTTLKLYSPMARVIHIALFELICDDGVYYPRLDPRKYVDGCIVTRRVTNAGLRRWGRDQVGTQSWSLVNSAELEQVYPDPAKQIEGIQTGDPELDRELMSHAPVFDESRVPMFLAPPAVCDALGRTVVYAVIQTSSSEIASAPSPFSDPNTLRNYVPSYLRASSGTQRVPFPSQYLSYGNIATALTAPNNGDNGLLLSFTLMLRQSVFEFGVFESQPTAQATQILNALAMINLKFQSGNTIYYVTANTFLRNAAEILVLRTNTGSLYMPVEWPPVPTATANFIRSAVTQIVNARIQNVRPQEGRFSNPRSRYIVRGYARVQPNPNCPPAIISSPNSTVFSIAPWFESKAPPIPIILPELDMEKLRQIKPNIAFAVPSELQSLLDLNDAKDLADGNGKNSSVQMTIDWLCSFSLPVITLCAFIVLNIFLQLFNIIFQWLLWLKVCIPIPRPTISDE